MTSDTKMASSRPTRRGVMVGSAIGLSVAGLAGVLAMRESAAPSPLAVRHPELAGPLGDVWIGAPEAKLTLIEYAAVTCSHCAAFHRETWPAVKARWVDTGQVRFAMRGFALNSLDTAAFMLARMDRGEHYYSTTDMLFDAQASWAFSPKPLDALRDLMRQTGLSRERFEATLNDQTLLDAVNLVRSRAISKLGVHATPTLYVGNSRHEGAMTSDALGEIIQKALA